MQRTWWRGVATTKWHICTLQQVTEGQRSAERGASSGAGLINAKDFVICKYHRGTISSSFNHRSTITACNLDMYRRVKKQRNIQFGARKGDELKPSWAGLTPKFLIDIYKSIGTIEYFYKATTIYQFIFPLFFFVITNHIAIWCSLKWNWK